jgi:opacity protein-like surface antigen
MSWRMKKLVLSAVVVAVLAIFASARDHVANTPAVSAPAAPASDTAIASAFESHASHVVVEGQGTVVKILSDDNDGSHHQRFIVRVGPRQTVLIAHNIDLAARVSPLNEGDVVAFSGEYEWNPKGGIVHWTHRDPEGRHAAGWIRHDGQVFD